jgi:hypothetical protein
LVGLAGAAFGLAAGSDFLTSVFFTGAAAFFTLTCAMIFVFLSETTCLKLDTLYSGGTRQGERFLAGNNREKLTHGSRLGRDRSFGPGVKKKGLIFATPREKSR